MAKKILIADDEPDVVRLISMRLRANGYDVVTALDGMQAVREAHNQRPDLILLDINMPGVNGYTVLENLRMATHTMMIPIVFVSALPESEVRKKAETLGADGYIPKPFDAQVLLNKIKSLLGDDSASAKP